MYLELLGVTARGSTHAGLALGESILGGPAVLGVSIGDPIEECRRRVETLIGLGAALLGEGGPGSITVLDGYQGDGYAIPTDAGMEGIRRLARSEGILLDPVYTSKAMAALLECAAEVEPPVIFLHSGRVPALFAYADEFDGS